MNPGTLTAPKLLASVGGWFALLASATPEASIAWAALNSRGYTAKAAGKGEGAGTDHHKEGQDLYDAFLATMGQRSGAGVVRKSGKQLLAAWEKARGSLSAARGSETNSQRSNIGAREAFGDWLGTWWGIARVRLADQPGVLAALGVASKSRRKKKTADAVAPIAEPKGTGG